MSRHTHPRPAEDFEAALAQLADPNRPPDRQLVRLLSAPSPAEVDTWQRSWARIELHRRRWIARCMFETTEASFEVDFRPLMVTMLDDSDAQVRALAIEGLWECEDPRLVGRLVRLLRQDRHPTVRARAAAALGNFVLLGELDRLDHASAGQAVEALVAAATDESEEVEVRRRATESAGYADHPAVRQLIREGIESPERALRAGALRAMGRSADQSWAPLVLARLEDENPELRFEAVRAAGELAIADAVPALLRLAEGDDPEIQFEAIWALGEIGGRAARRALERMAAWAEDEELADALQEALAMVALGEGQIDWTMFATRLPEDNERPVWRPGSQAGRDLEP